MATPGFELVSGRNNAVRLYPAHEERKGDKHEDQNRQCDSQGQKFDRTIGIVTVLDQAEHARAKTEQDQQQ